MRILLATDFSGYAEIAGALVAGMALPAGSAVRVVHGVEPLPMLSAFAPAAVTTIAEGVERESRDRLHAAAAGLEGPGRSVDVALGYGRGADIVIDEAEAFHPDLIVMGSRGRGAIASAVLGSVSAEVIDRAPCPVLIARKSTLGGVLLADDGSRSASLGAALVAAPYLRGAAVRVVSVVDAPYPLLTGDPTGAGTMAAISAYEEALPILREAHGKIAHDRVASLAAAGVSASAEVREGDTVAELVASAVEHQDDLVIVGSRGTTGLRRLVLGSVARGVLFAAPCSVLVAHAPVTASVAEDGETAMARR